MAGINIDDFINRIAASSASGSSTGGSSAQQEPSVYWGGVRGTNGGRQVSGAQRLEDGKSTIRRNASRKASTIQTKTLSEAQGEFYRWSDADRAKWGQHLLNLALIDEDEVENYTVLKQAWDEIVGESANFTTAGKQLTPWQVAELLAGSESARSGRRAKSVADKPFSGTKSTTSTAVDLTDPETAKALVNDILSRQLGRAANDDERAAFLSVLNNAERANPTTTRTSTNYVDGEATSQSSTTSGGLTAAGKQQMLQDRTQALPEYGAYQAATTYYDAFASALGAVV